MTSNIGSQWIAELAPGQETEMRRRVMEAMRAQFRPEFLNRVDEIIIFNQLTREDLKQIVGLQIDQLRQRLQERHIDIELTETAKELLVDEGYDPVYGARPLKRTIQRQILDPLAKKVLAGEFKEGDAVLVDALNGELSFSRKEAEVPDHTLVNEKELVDAKPIP
jgi:ATP-dependent Clp protease ATP-binding subunit ClpB